VAVSEAAAAIAMEACLSYLGGCLVHDGHLCVSLLSKGALLCMLKRIPSICSKSNGITISPKQAGSADNPMESLLRGDVIKEEFWDMECDTDDVVNKATESAKILVRKCPAMVFGLSRQAKSTTINDLLGVLGDDSRPAKQSQIDACTRGVDAHRRQVFDWATPGVTEELILFDTEGWEFGQQAKAVGALNTCMQMAKEENIPREVLNHRLILVLVAAVTHCDCSNNSMYMSLMERICKGAADAAKPGKPALLLVLTKSDLFTAGDHVQTPKDLANLFKQRVEEKVKSIVTVHDPVVLTSPSHSRRDGPPDVEKLNAALKQICKQQLKAESVLNEAKNLIARDLKEFLMEWDKKGIDHSAALVRRYLWTVARLHGARIEGLMRCCPMLPWDSTQKVFKNIKAVYRKNNFPGLEAEDAWHTDVRRSMSHR